MVAVRPHSEQPSEPGRGIHRPAPDACSRPGSAGGGGRLNLLLSCASWKTQTWADALPTLLEPMGVSSVRARSAKEAEHVIRTAPVHIAVVDLGLPLDHSASQPDESGQRILDLLMRLSSPPPTVVVRSSRTARDSQRDVSAALKWGAFAVVDRASADLELMLQIMQRCLCRFYKDRWPG